MGENKDYMTHPEKLGSIHISEEVLASIAAEAAQEVDGISGLMSLATKKMSAKGVRVTSDENGAVVDLYVMIRYGVPIPEVAEKLQNAVDTAIRSMTGFEVNAVNIHVGGVSFQ